jgi:signal transduction histidine kinase
VIRLVERSETEPEARDAAGGASGVAPIARRALAADAVILLELDAPGHTRVLETDGLSDTELDVVNGWCAARARARSGDGIGPRGFPRARWEVHREDGLTAVALFALQRRLAAFANDELAGVFARHAAVGATLHPTPGSLRRAPQTDRELDVAGTLPGGHDGDAQPDLCGLWDPDDAGYSALHDALGRELRAATGALGWGVLVWDESSRALTPIPGSFGRPADEVASAHDADDWGSSTARVFATGQPYLTNHAVGDRGVLQGCVRAFELERLVTVPLEIEGRRIGVLQATNKPGDFTFGDVQRAMRLAPRVAVGVRVAAIRHGLVKRQRLDDALGHVAVDIASGRNLQEFLRPALDSVCAALEGSMIALVPAHGDPLIRRRGPERGHLEELVLRQAREITTVRIHSSGRRRPHAPGWSAGHVPIQLDGAPVATLSVLRMTGEALGEVDCRALSRLSELVSLAWATERYQHQRADAARVAERQRIAEQLHDEVAQLLFAARLSLDSAQEVPDLPETASASVERGRDLLLRAEAATRRVMEQNSHSEELGLAERLAALVGSIEEEFARPVALQIAPDAQAAAGTLTRSTTSLVARAAREALVNAAKHAGPCQLAVSVSVTRRNRLLLTVTDGGIGMGTAREDGYGTSALRRAVRRQGGLLRVASVPAGGTKVAVSLPL